MLKVLTRQGQHTSTGSEVKRPAGSPRAERRRRSESCPHDPRPALPPAGRAGAGDRGRLVVDDRPRRAVVATSPGVRRTARAGCGTTPPGGTPASWPTASASRGATTCGCAAASCVGRPRSTPRCWPAPSQQHWDRLGPMVPSDPVLFSSDDASEHLRRRPRGRPPGRCRLRVDGADAARTARRRGVLGGAGRGRDDPRRRAVAHRGPRAVADRAARSAPAVGRAAAAARGGRRRRTSAAGRARPQSRLPPRPPRGAAGATASS